MEFGEIIILEQKYLMFSLRFRFFLPLTEKQERRAHLVNPEILEGIKQTERMFDEGLKNVQNDLVLQERSHDNVKEKMR